MPRTGTLRGGAHTCAYRDSDGTQDLCCTLRLEGVGRVTLYLMEDGGYDLYTALNDVAVGERVHHNNLHLLHPEPRPEEGPPDGVMVDEQELPRLPRDMRLRQGIRTGRVTATEAAQRDNLPQGYAEWRRQQDEPEQGEQYGYDQGP